MGGSEHISDALALSLSPDKAIELEHKSLTSILGKYHTLANFDTWVLHHFLEFAGSSSVPAHVEMMGFLGIGKNPMVGCTVAVAVAVALALAK